MSTDRLSQMIKDWADRLEREIVLLRVRQQAGEPLSAADAEDGDAEILSRLDSLLNDLRQAEILARTLEARQGENG